MKVKQCKRILLVIASALLVATTVTATITPTSDDFSSDTTASWISVGVTNTTIVYDSTTAGDYDDGSITTKLAYTNSMTLTGDGISDLDGSDGGLRLDTQDAIAGSEAIALTIAGTMEEGEKITFSGSVYNDNSSYCPYNAQLWNTNDNTLLAESGNISVDGINATNYVPIDFSVSYTAQASDEGDTLQIRFLENANATGRDVYVDNFDLSSIPPDPSVQIITWDFNSDSGLLTNDVIEWDYTSRQAYDASTAVANTLAFNGEQSATDYQIEDKGPGHENALLCRTIKTDNADFGIYLHKLDFRLDNMNLTNRTRVSWSFDILGTDHVGVVPTNWTVKVNTGNSAVDLTVTDASYGNDNSVVAQTFDFVSDDATWTTITGSYMIAVNQAGSAGGIQISTDNGGYTSADGIVLDNIQVTIESVVPLPGVTDLAWNFNNDGPSGTILTNDVAKYDYTRDTEYAVSNATINTLAFNGRSSSTDYIIRDKGPDHTSTLFYKTVDTDATDFGIYIQKLDFTTGGMSVSNITRISWSFDILGYDSNAALDPTGWTIKIQSDNTDLGLNVSDGWYASAALAQTFSFTDDSTGETATDGTWTTITGSYDIAVGSIGTVGGIQISTDGGNYTSGGGIFLDNIVVTIESVELVVDPNVQTLKWDFNLDTDPVAENIAQYDYTSDQAYIGSNAVANTLAFNGGSSGTDYQLKDKGLGHEKCLFFRTINPQGNDVGVYLQKMDFRNNNMNTSNKILVSWSFDILGYDTLNGGTEDIFPTNWTVRVNYGNYSENINVSDAWFNNSSSAEAQTFDFVDDNSTWTTITGSYEIAINQAGSAGSIQIRQPLGVGEYTSGGGIYLDNVEITIAPIDVDLGTYAGWASGYGLTEGALGDDDADGLSNLEEYGLGGDPNFSAINGYSPVYELSVIGGTNWFYFVHPAREGAALNYYLEISTNLVSGAGWTNANYEVLGTAIDGFGSGFNAVTNRILMEGPRQQFIRLNIGEL